MVTRCLFCRYFFFICKCFRLVVCLVVKRSTRYLFAAYEDTVRTDSRNLRPSLLVFRQRSSCSRCWNFDHVLSHIVEEKRSNNKEKRKKWTSRQSLGLTLMAICIRIVRPIVVAVIRWLTSLLRKGFHDYHFLCAHAPVAVKASWWFNTVNMYHRTDYAFSL